MQYHPSGAINVIDSAPLGVPDGLEGQFNANGYLRVLIDDSTDVGYYDLTGATRVTDTTLGTDPVGIYAADGSINAVFVDGNSRVGLYSPTGALNLFLQT